MMATTVINFVNQLTARQTGHWNKASFLQYGEELAVKEMVGQFKLGCVFDANGPIQTMAISNDGQYLASGHTSPDHSIIIHYLRPEIKPFNKLVGHLRSPWCLSFDPLCMYILYSGCLGGIVNRWNIKTGARLSTFSTGEKGPCNGVQPLPFDPPRVLIAMLYCLYLVDGEDMMEVLWKVDSTRGLIRHIRYYAEGSKLLTVIKEQQFPRIYRVQVRCDYDLEEAPDLTDGSVGLMSSGCVVQSPQCILMSSTNVIFMHRSALVVCNHFTINSEIYYTSPMERFWKPDRGKNKYSRITFVHLSPCEKYLLLCTSANTLSIIDMEQNKSLMEMTLDYNLNCGFWMPPTSHYPLRVCAGSRTGQIFLYGHDVKSKKE